MRLLRTRRVRQSAGAVSSAARMTTRQLFKTCILMCLYHIDVSMSMCRSTHVSDEFSIPFTFGAATVRCFTSNLIQPLLWPSVTLATLSADD
jgi:hypothetical protein